jgi:hypothetical protein
MLACLPQVVAKKLDRRLQALGASPLLERGLGDDQVCAGAYLLLRQAMLHQSQQPGSPKKVQCPRRLAPSS